MTEAQDDGETLALTLVETDVELDEGEEAAQRAAIDAKLAKLNNPTKRRARQHIRQFHNEEGEHPPRKRTEQYQRTGTQQDGHADGYSTDEDGYSHKQQQQQPDGTARRAIKLAISKVKRSRSHTENTLDGVSQRDFAQADADLSQVQCPTASSSASYLELAAVPSRTSSSRSQSPTSEPASVNESELAIANRQDHVLLTIPVPPAQPKGGRPARSNSILDQAVRRTTTLTKAMRSAAERRNKLHRRKKGQKGQRKAGEEEEDLLVDALIRAGLLEKEIPEAWETDLLWENQRGLWLLGARYGGKALFPLDPKPFTDRNGEDSAYTTSTYPLPTPAWRWHHSSWLVNMAGDVDSEGWMYSTRFSSKYWRGIPDIRFFVRRRLWIRSRYRAGILAQGIPKLTDPHAETPEKLGLPIQSHRPSDAAETRARRTTHLNPYMPFLTWYAGAKSRYSEHKEDNIHENFVRVARVLVRMTHVDRERVGWWEWWLGMRGAPEYGRSEEDEKPNEEIRPDIRDVWDLLEARVMRFLH